MHVKFDLKDNDSFIPDFYSVANIRISVELKKTSANISLFDSKLEIRFF